METLLLKEGRASCRSMSNCRLSTAATQARKGATSSHFKRRWKCMWNDSAKVSTNICLFSSTISMRTVAVDRVRGHGTCNKPAKLPKCE